MPAAEPTSWSDMRPHRTTNDLGDVPGPGESSAGSPLADPYPAANGGSSHGEETSAADRPSLDEAQGDSEQIARLFEMTGDLLATVRVHVPKKISKEERALIEKLAELDGEAAAQRARAQA